MDMHLKSVFDATANLNGARNGRAIGRRLNTVRTAVEEMEIKVRSWRL